MRQPALLMRHGSPSPQSGSPRRGSAPPRWSHIARLFVVPLAAATLGGCGSGGGVTVSLSIEGPASYATASATATVTGEGFVPPGSTCSPSAKCDIGSPPVFGILGAYTIRWSNAATGQSGDTTGPFGGLWVCNCMPGPEFSAAVPLASGANRITITQQAGGTSQSADVTVTRQ